MNLDRRVHVALEAAGDTTSALLWRRVCSDLTGPLTVGLLSADASALRHLRSLVEALDNADVRWVEVPVDDDATGPSLGAEDRLLACHVVLAATSYTRALGSEERTRLAALAPVAPGARQVVLVGRNLLDRVSDRPEEEAAEVLERAQAVAPEGWPVVPETELADWLGPLLADRAPLTRARTTQVAALLLEGAAESLDAEWARHDAERAEVIRLLDGEDEALDAARKEGRRTAAHVLAAVRRHTDTLLVELRAFLTELERDVPDQAESIDALPILRRALPHWLHHVVETWLAERLERWRRELAADLEEVGVDKALATRAELVVPAMAPGPVHADGSWTSRLGATAAMGGGAALLLAGLIGLSGSVGAAQAEVTVEFWHSFDGSGGEALGEIIENFQAANPDIRIDAQFIGNYNDIVAKLQAAIPARRAPDAVIMEVTRYGLFADRGVLLDLTEKVDNDPLKDDLFDFAREVGVFEGKNYIVPFNSSTPVLYYNKDLLKEVGAEPPKTYEEMETVMKKLADKGHAGFSQSLTPWIMFENFKSRHNLQLSDNNNGYDGLSSKIMFNTKDMMMHVQKLKAWSDEGYYKYYGSDWEANQTPFERQEVAMWMGSSGSFGGLRNRVKFDLGTTYLPYWESITKKPTHTFIGGAALFALNGHDSNQDKGVAAFFAYLTKPETQKYWHETTGYVPVTEAAYELTKASGYYQEQPDAEVGVKQLSLTDGKWTKGYRLGYYPQIREVMHREFDNIFAGRESVEQGLNKVENESTKLLKRFARTVN